MGVSGTSIRNSHATSFIDTSSIDILSINSLPTTQYIGRFAPSPTGPLHFGSLVAAVASYLSARQYPQSTWLLRIEDIDSQRNQQGATQSIIKSLDAYGFEWDGEITYQSARSEIYKEALTSINHLIYPCSCTRKSLKTRIKDFGNPGNYSYIYPNFCRNGLTNPTAKNTSIRLKTNNTLIRFSDQCQPDEFAQNIQQEVGDFILKRSDGLWAYQLAVVVDDALQGVTDIVRGADLFDNTPRQIYLQKQLGYATPKYLHFPVAVYADGKKLSKQNLSPEISMDKKQATLVHALNFLGQKCPHISDFSSIDDVWNWAIKHWDSNNIPKKMTQELEHHE